jgi:hypothetical protein
VIACAPFARVEKSHTITLVSTFLTLRTLWEEDDDDVGGGGGGGDDGGDDDDDDDDAEAVVVAEGVEVIRRSLDRKPPADFFLACVCCDCGNRKPEIVHCLR